jgi:hypothetical protein
VEARILTDVRVLGWAGIRYEIPSFWWEMHRPLLFWRKNEICCESEETGCF